MNREVFTRINGLEIKLASVNSNGNEDALATFSIKSLNSKANSNPNAHRRRRKPEELQLTFRPKYDVDFSTVSIYGDGRIKRTVLRVANEMGQNLFLGLLRSLIDLAATSVYTVTFDEHGNKNIKEHKQAVIENTPFALNQFVTREEAEEYNGEIPSFEVRVGMLDLTDPNFDPEPCVIAHKTKVVGTKPLEFESPEYALNDRRRLIERNLERLRSCINNLTYDYAQEARGIVLEHRKRMLEQLKEQGN